MNSKHVRDRVKKKRDLSKLTCSGVWDELTLWHYRILFWLWHIMYDDDVVGPNHSRTLLFSVVLPSFISPCVYSTDFHFKRFYHLTRKERAQFGFFWPKSLFSRLIIIVVKSNAETRVLLVVCYDSEEGNYWLTTFTLIKHFEGMGLQC